MRRFACLATATFVAMGIVAACSSFSGEGATAGLDSGDEITPGADGVAPVPPPVPTADLDGAVDADAEPDAAFFTQLFVNLVGAWNFDEEGGTTVVDIGGAIPNNGTMKGAVSRTDAGRHLRGLFFAKVDSGYGHVDIPPHPELDSVMTTGALTLSAWVNLSNPSQDPWLITMDSVFGLKLNNGKIELFVGPAYAAATDPLAANTWYHVAATFDHGVVKFYLDGFPLGMTAPFDAGVRIPDANAGTGTIHIGVDNGGFNPANGTIDSVFYWTRALTQDEITFLATAK